MDRTKAAGMVVLSFSMLFWAVWAGEALAQGLGSKPVKLLVAAAPGGTEDLGARAFIPLLGERLKTTVSVENHPGAGGKMGFQKFKNAAPDGHTICMVNYPRSIILEFMGETDFRTMDFTPICSWGKNAPILLTHADSPFKTFADFVKEAKARPLAGGVAVVGAVTHLASLILMDDLGAKVRWVPFNSGAESLTALAGKHLDFVVVLPGAAASLMDAGKIRPLLVLGDQRDQYVPDVPIPKELGFNFVPVPAIQAAFAPPKTPPAIAKILEAAIADAAKDPVFLDFMKKTKMTLASMTSEQLGKMTKELYPRIEKIAPAFKEQSN